MARAAPGLLLTAFLGLIFTSPAATQPPSAPDVGLHPQCNLFSLTSVPNVQGTVTTRYGVTCAGWDFYGALVTVESDSNGAVVTPGGIVIQPPALQTFDPTLNSAGSFSESDAFASLAALYQISPENFALYAQNNRTQEIWYEFNTGVIAAYYVLFNYELPDGSERKQPTAIVDRTTGEIRSHWNGFNGANATMQNVTGIGGNFYFGTYTRKVWSYSDGVQFCFWNGAARYQVNNYNGTANSTGRPFCGTLQSIVSNATTVPRINNALYYAPMVDAAYSAKLADDMFRAAVGVGFNGNSTAMVHININYKNMDDSYTDTVANEIYIGAGVTKYFPLATCNDVVVHELAHIFTARYSKLPNTGQAGALNEAFSDIAAGTAKNLAMNTSWLEYAYDDYYFGNKCIKPGTNRTYIRNSCEVDADGNGIYHIEDYYPGMNIYIASGIFRFAFCMIVHCYVNTITYSRVFQAFAKANMLYWNYKSTFVTAACDVYRVAKTIFTAYSELRCFEDAFYFTHIDLLSICP